MVNRIASTLPQFVTLATAEVNRPCLNFMAPVSYYPTGRRALKACANVPSSK